MKKTNRRKRKIILYSAVSLDGFVADENDGVEWLEDEDYETEGNYADYMQLMNRVDTAIMGAETLRVVDGFDVPWPYPTLDCYAITRNTEGKTHEHATYTSDWKGLLEKLEGEDGKDIWLIGGGQINALFLDHDMIDEMILTLMPVALGSGKPLFPGITGPSKFRLSKTEEKGGGMVQLTYLMKK